jgi:DNA-directed RNA polymerase specialized sigma24 family protein
MSRLATSSIVRKIESLFDGGSIAGWSDRELLERFYRQRDATGETAFAVIVARHGPVVLHVCRQLLGNSHDAEDAFQAVFFVLARKADRIRDPDLLGNWLYGVAIRTARKAKAKIGRSAKAPAADAHGRIVFPALIPGATYRISDQTTARTPDGPQLRREFTAAPGETLDLGDILIEKPE